MPQSKVNKKNNNAPINAATIYPSKNLSQSLPKYAKPSWPSGISIGPLSQSSPQGFLLWPASSSHCSVCTRRRIHAWPRSGLLLRHALLLVGDHIGALWPWTAPLHVVPTASAICGASLGMCLVGCHPGQALPGPPGCAHHRSHKLQYCKSKHVKTIKTINWIKTTVIKMSCRNKQRANHIQKDHRISTFQSKFHPLALVCWLWQKVLCLQAVNKRVLSLEKYII